MSLTALTIGGLTALYIAGMLTFYLYRAIGRSLASFSTAAQELAAGNDEVRVTSTKLGPEFDSLAGSFNDMAAKLDAVDTTRRQMLADLAHEMRTPLASLKGHLEGIEDGVVEWDERTTGILHAQIARLERLARDIRQLTAAEEGMTRLQLTPQDPEHLAVQAVAAIEPHALGKGVSITSRSTGMECAPVPLDRERMGQVLSNLLENALRHTPPGAPSPCTPTTPRRPPPSPSPIPARASATTISRTCSSASTAPTPAGKPTASARDWAWPSANPWSRPTAGPWRPPVMDPGAGPASGFICPAEFPPTDSGAVTRLFSHGDGPVATGRAPRAW